ncbi:MAG: tetratricopeptide repeat protein [Bacteroidaceae bacterium]|nr:tetratricopeptide repeat protein [Bacteroidaceae bacterium]
MKQGRKIIACVASLFIFGVPLQAQINTDRMMSVGRTALYFDDYVLSIQYFNQVINAKPYLAEPYFYRAVAKLSLEDYRGAEQDCSNSLSRNPFVVNSYQVRGLARVYQERYTEAADDFRAGLRLDPGNTSLRHNLILCLAKSGKQQDAILAVDTLLASSPRYAPAMAMLSDLLWEQGDSTEALEWVNKALDVNRYDADMIHHRGVMLARMERYEEAEEDLDRSIYLDPGNAGAYITRAMIRYFRNNLNGALADYDLSIMIDPANVTGHYNRGNLRAQIGDDNRAIEDFDIVLEAEPDNMMATFYRGVLRENTGDYRGAEQDMTRVLEEYPQFVQGYQMRSEVREKLGDRRGAEEDAMVVLREQNRRFNNAMGYSDPEDEDDSKTRERSDKNVRNYRKIVVDENLENSTGFSSEYRGKVQNRNVEVQFLEPYRLTYYRDNNLTVNAVHGSKVVDDLSASGCFMSEILLDNHDVQLDERQIDRLFADIGQRTQILLDDPGNAWCMLLARAIDFALLQDFTNAESDLDNAVSLNPDNWAVWFCRAQVRARSIQVRRAEQDMDLKQGMTDARDNVAEPGYQFVLRDLSYAINLEPSFAYAYYNRGTFYALTNDFHAALVDLDKAIELDETLAEAWYNRGLVLVLLNRMDDAFRDLSRAGELGIYSAYNIIKRFSKGD